ncbi:MAG: hypothetical protein JNL72_15520 [Flavipsychrobacter sp.]|nr:hypothetical protein [Flavipsychrobacter sp.]
MKDYEMSSEQATSVLQYCSQLECKIDSNGLPFCDGCILRTMIDGDNFNRDDYFEIIHDDGTKTTISHDKKFMFAGSLDELEEDEKGIETWKIAEKLLK